MSEKHIGSSLDDYLKDEGTFGDLAEDQPVTGRSPP